MTSVEIALRMETDAIKFYREAADRTSNPVGKKMFLSIVDDEKRHVEMISQILKGLDLHAKDANPVKAVRTIFEEMKPQMMERVAATKDEVDAFKIAMDMEKEGVEFYRKAMAEAPSEKEKALFQRLLKEEEAHYNIFSNTFSFMNDSGNWYMWEEHGIVEG
ncbi:MAG TPA: ferritin family protein [Dissulfurispiraceae bacterium]|nr:ferritin family protein [Dissulfurispiraceae bacterium]